MSVAPPNVLAFDPQTRTSSRRLAPASQPRPVPWLVGEPEAEAAELAAALGMRPRDLVKNPDFYYHAHLLRDVEAAYRSSPAKGRQALLAILLTQYGDGYQTGLADASLGAGRGAGRRP